MTLLTCAAVRRRLAAFYDRELPIGELIAFEHHIKDCPPCARELRELESIGTALRLGASAVPAEDWAGFAPGVISRMCAENQESWRARAGRLMEDFHFVWIGLASTAASLLCAAIALGTVASASQERHANSLAAVFAVMAAPSGSDANPARLDWRYRVPSVPQDSVVQQTLENSMLDDTLAGHDSMLTLSAVVTREGTLADLSVLRNDRRRERVNSLLGALSHARLQPAELEGAPIAVNLVWLVAQTTVRPRGRS